MNSTSADVRWSSARQRPILVGLTWHVGAFLVIDAAFWLIDLTLGQQGIHWAFWITAMWGFASAFRLLACLVAGRRLGQLTTDQYLERRSRRCPGSTIVPVLLDRPGSVAAPASPLRGRTWGRCS